MNKSIYKSILLILVIGILTFSCTELTQEIPNFETEESFWETKEDFYQGLIGAYDFLQTGDMYAGQIQHTLNLLSDEGFTGQLGDPYNLATFSSDLNNEFHVTLWYSFYTLIARSYQVIERGENSDISGIEGIIGEAKFLVALSYYKLITVPNGSTYDRYWQEDTPATLVNGISKLLLRLFQNSSKSKMFQK